MRVKGRFPSVNKTPEEMLTITSSQLAGLKRGHETMTAAVEGKYLVEGGPRIESGHGVLDCKRLCMCQSCSSLTLKDLLGYQTSRSSIGYITNNHHLQDREWIRGVVGDDGARGEKCWQRSWPEM